MDPKKIHLSSVTKVAGVFTVATKPSITKKCLKSAVKIYKQNVLEGA